MNENPKHVIFASNGFKPEIGFEDAVSNKITILKNEESCLVYDFPIDRNLGLVWEDMVFWWQRTKYFEQTNDSDLRKSLGKRLLAVCRKSPRRLVLMSRMTRIGAFSGIKSGL